MLLAAASGETAPTETRSTRRSRVAPAVLGSSWMRRICPLLLPASVFSSGYLGPASGAVSGGTTFFVDCVRGDDGAAGSSTSSAWKTLARVGRARLHPGDSLLLRRGFTW
jgi:hypothetical protein